MHYPTWIHCSKWSNYDFCISQGSVAIVLKWDGQNYSHLRQVSSWCCMPIIIKIYQCFMELFKKCIVLWTTVYIVHRYICNIHLIPSCSIKWRSTRISYHDWRAYKLLTCVIILKNSGLWSIIFSYGRDLVAKNIKRDVPWDTNIVAIQPILPFVTDCYIIYVKLTYLYNMLYAIHVNYALILSQHFYAPVIC